MNSTIYTWLHGAAAVLMLVSFFAPLIGSLSMAADSYDSPYKPGKSLKAASRGDIRTDRANMSQIILIPIIGILGGILIGLLTNGVYDAIADHEGGFRSDWASKLSNHFSLIIGMELTIGGVAIFSMVAFFYSNRDTWRDVNSFLMLLAEAKDALNSSPPLPQQWVQEAEDCLRTLREKGTRQSIRASEAKRHLEPSATPQINTDVILDEVPDFKLSSTPSRISCLSAFLSNYKWHLMGCGAAWIAALALIATPRENIPFILLGSVTYIIFLALPTMIILFFVARPIVVTWIRRDEIENNCANQLEKLLSTNVTL